jgi:hypothetical protein
MKSSIAAALSLALLICLPAQAQKYKDFPIEDRLLLWEEAIASFDGTAYRYITRTFASESHARDCLNDYFSCFRDRSGGPVEAEHRYNEIPLPIREKVVALGLEEVSEPVHSSSDGQWFIFEMLSKQDSQFVGAVNPGDWLEGFAARALPSPSELRNDPKLVLRRKLNQVANRADLRKLRSQENLQPADLDSRLSNGTTLLIKAIHNSDLEMMAALLGWGASVNQCGAAQCPLSTAVEFNLPTAVDFLLKNKANANGSRDNDTPLIHASLRGDRSMAAKLIGAGADVLKTRKQQTEGFEFRRSMLFYSAPEPVEYSAWLSSEMERALGAMKKYQWSAWIEQDGKRTLVQDGASIALRKRPFRLLMKMAPNAGFRVLASEDPMFLEQSKNFGLRQQLLNAFRVGASNDDSRYLSVFSKIRMDGDSLHFNITSNEWAYSEAPGQKNGTRRITGNDQAEYQHMVDELIVDGQVDSITKYKGKELAVVMGVLPPLGTPVDYFKPVRIRLKLQP